MRLLQWLLIKYLIIILHVKKKTQMKITNEFQDRNYIEDLKEQIKKRRIKK